MSPEALRKRILDRDVVAWLQNPASDKFLGRVTASDEEMAAAMLAAHLASGAMPGGGAAAAAPAAAAEAPAAAPVKAAE